MEERGVELPPLSLGIKVRRYGTPVRTRGMTYVSGVAGPRRVFCHNSSVHNAHLAAAIRVLTAKVNGKFVSVEKTRPPPGHSDLLVRAQTDLLRHLPKLVPIPREKFPGLYGGQKKLVYERAVESLRLTPLDRRDSEIRGFIKFEKMLENPVKPKVPRMISPPSPRYLVATGQYIKPAEESVYVAINAMFGFKVVTKGMNYEQVGQLFKDHWDAMVDPVSLDIDVEKMDRSTSAEMLGWTHKPVIRCFDGHDAVEIQQLLAQQLDVRTTVRCDDGVLRYRVHGTLTSGQMNTSLVGVLMVCSTMYSYLHGLGIKYRFVDAGDDCTIILERKDLDKFRQGVREFFRSVGFELTISDPNYTLEGIEFCQTHPVDVLGKYTMVRNARDAATKDATSQQQLRTKKEMAVWLKAVSLCGLATHGRVPIAQSLYQCYGRNADRMLSELHLSGRQRKRVGFAVARKVEDFWDDRRHKSGTGESSHGSGEIVPLTRVSYMKAFGIVPPHQVAAEEYYDNLVINFDREVPWNRATFNPNWL